MLAIQKQIRDEFWNQNPQFKRSPRKTQNAYPADVRTAFCEFVDSLRRSGEISEALASRVTL